jgi:PhnB protein
MITLNIYLTFNGNCREVFNFYKSVFGGEFQYIGTYGDIPAQEDIVFDKEEQDKIMHITLPISKETMLMGNDHIKAFGPAVQTGNNFVISIKTDSKQTADEIFIKLSEGGLITMPLKETFWGSYYGNVTDKFGIKWKMNVDLNELK